VPEALTFAVPYHRSPGHLAGALASVRAQDEGGWSLVVCDDSEAGEGAAVVAALGDPRARVVRTRPGAGIAANWNACLEAARTELVTLLHEDDELLPGYARLMRGAAARDPGATAFFCRARVIDGAGRVRFSFPEWVKDRLAPSTARAFALEGEAGLARLARGNFIMCPTLCYRRSALGARRFRADLRMALDLELTAGLLLAGQRLVGLPEIEYAYRRHGQSATAGLTRGLARFDEELRVYEEIAAAAASRGWPRAARIAAGKPMVRLQLTAEAARALAAGAPREAWSALRLARAGRPRG